MRSKLNQWAHRLKRELRVLYHASKDPELPFIPKAMLALTIQSIPEEIFIRAKKKTKEEEPEIEINYTASGVIVSLLILVANVLGLIIFRQQIIRRVVI